MGDFLSINHLRQTGLCHVPHKRLKTSSSSSPSSSNFWDDKPQLIPGLPDDISHQIIARLPRISYLNLKAVSRSWKTALTSPEIYKVRKELGTTEEWLYILMHRTHDGLFWHALDPVSKRWQRLPPIPNAHYRTGLSGYRIRYCRGAISAVDGCLYMLEGVSRYPSLTSHIWKGDPVSNCWSEVNPMSVGRAYFQTGVLNNKLFVVGGISFSQLGVNHYSKTPLQSADVFDPQTGLWSDIPSMPCSKAQVLLEDLHTPVATGLASYRGKLYVPQCFGDGGEVYDPETNSWVDMPTGMGEGWPTCLWKTKPSVIVDGDLYALVPIYSLEGGLEVAKVYVYNHHDDSWKVVEGDVPLRDLSPYILTGLLGKLHVVTVDDDDNIVVKRADKQDDLIASSGEESLESVASSESNIWNVIASGNFRFGRLEGCQNLDI